jgi:hypothetical protein
MHRTIFTKNKTGTKCGEIVVGKFRVEIFANSDFDFEKPIGFGFGFEFGFRI